MVTTKRKSKQLGQILLEQGLLTQEQLDRALEEHRNTPKSLGRVLIDLGYIRERDLVAALAEQVGLEFVDLTEYHIDAAATALVPETVSRRYRALPIGERDGKLLVAMSDPANVYALDDIRTITGRDVQPVVATAADVDIERGEKKVRIRFRVDGVLHEPMPAAPKSVQGGLISRLKVMADLNIAEKRVPQDGRISMKVGGKALDLRLATLPTVYGEKVVIRVLDTTNALLKLE